MAEVSSNENTGPVGQHVDKGEGMFHFGGTTYSQDYRPETQLELDLRGQEPGLDTTNIAVRSHIAPVIV
jgi:phosphatidylserine decarboxylase